MTRRAIRFLRRGRLVEVADAHPRTTLLDWLRLREGSTGTKEGCAEGDCGACTVVLARATADGLAHRPVNACILLLGQADGAEVLSVEDLGQDGLHPVQAAMVARHGSQCGFCTPGIVMSLFALHQDGPWPPTRADISDALAGNLCRCTGYRPILAAARDAGGEAPTDRFASSAPERRAALRALDDDADLFVGDDERFLAAPASEEALARLLLRHPDATPVAGGTDVGPWITKALLPLERIVWLGRVRGLDHIEEGEDALVLGATATHEAARPHLARLDPDLGEVMRRFGSRQVRAVGTVGGNVANGSPIGDLNVALLALGASVELRRGSRVRALPLERFFLGYRRQDREPGEFLRRLIVPRPGPGEHVRAYKVSKRFDEDISAVTGAFRIAVEGGRIAAARLAYGGMAAVPKRAERAEAALRGARLDDRAAWAPALAALGEDFAPLSDHRASAGYRAQVARNLLLKALLEIGGAPTRTTRLAGHREGEDGAG